MRRRARGKRGAGNRGAAADDRWIWGIHPVRRVVECSPACVDVLCVTAGKGSRSLSDLATAAARAGIEVRTWDARQLEVLAGAGKHQGVAARLGPFGYADLGAILSATPELVVALDCLQDPRNLGAILRTAEAVAAGGVLLPKDRAAGVTGAVVRAAAGHVCRVPIARVTNLARAIGMFKARGCWAVGLAANADKGLYEIDIPGRVLLVVGGEGKGLRPLVARVCDELVSLPMAPGVDSLNAAVAAGIALYELARFGSRRRTKGPSGGVSAAHG